MIKKVVIASGNPGKIEEFNQLLKLWQVKLIPQAKFSVPEEV